MRAKKSRYIGYMKGIQRISAGKEKTSTKESVLTRLKRLRDKEFTMTIPVAEGSSDEH